jgi:hypothetical protein
MIADLDTLLTALYVELTDRIIPVRGFTRCGPGGRPEVTDAELVCTAGRRCCCGSMTSGTGCGSRRGGRVPAGPRARVIQRLLALNACIWRNWLIGAPVKRSLIAYGHV